MTDHCGIYWGSHGCSKAPGHVAAGDPVHRCGLTWPEIQAAHPDAAEPYDSVCSEAIELTEYATDDDPPRNGAVRFCLQGDPRVIETLDDGDWSPWGPSHLFE